MKFRITFFEIDPFKPRQYWNQKTKFANAPDRWTPSQVWEYYNEEFFDEMEVVNVEACE